VVCDKFIQEKFMIHLPFKLDKSHQAKDSKVYRKYDKDAKSKNYQQQHVSSFQQGHSFLRPNYNKEIMVRKPLQ